MTDLYSFIEESNRIEDIHRVTAYEVAEHERFLALPLVRVDNLERFVRESVGTILRERPGMNVTVGSHEPPIGGPHIRGRLSDLLVWAQESDPSPWEVHVAYEKLHPFLDGNGRSGRVLWAWLRNQLGRDPFALGFLHSAYYEALEASREER